MKNHETIKALAKALYDTRPASGAAFDPDFALNELLSFGAPAGAQLFHLGSLCQGLRMDADFNRLREVLDTGYSQRAAGLNELYQLAILSHEPFTDVLGLANELMFKRYRVRLPDYFVVPGFRAYCQAFAEKSLIEGLPVISDDHDRSSSGVLASMSGLLRQPELLAQRKVRILIHAQNETALKMLFLQLGHALCNFLHVVEWVKISEGSSDKKTLVMAVQREQKMKEAA